MSAISIAKSAQLPTLIRVLREVGKRTEIIGFEDGSKLLILPHGGRVLGLFPAASRANFFWTHPFLASSNTAHDLFGQMRWPNPGGDRTWLTPSPELFIPDMRRIWQTYREPPQLDPGNYLCNTYGGALRLSNRARLPLYRTGGNAFVEITKSFGAALNPLRHEHEPIAEIAYAGYTTSVSLRLISGPKKVRLALWLLIQLPRAGEMILPTYSNPRPITVFGKVNAADLRLGNNLMRYRMASRSSAKIAVRAVSTAGRMGYLSKSGTDQWDLVIRNFSVNPSGEYIDPPFDDLNDLGYSVQACNVAEESIGHFSEIEHHVPAVGYGTGIRESTDISQVWAYRGRYAAIRKIGKQLLGNFD